jgi:pyrimidine deaminase RibD-like protein
MSTVNTAHLLSSSTPSSSDSNTSAHWNYLQQCLSLARKSPPKPSNFRVGAMLVLRPDVPTVTRDDIVISTGYTLELPGNTHAEQCCLSKFATAHSVTEDCIGDILAAEYQNKQEEREEEKEKKEEKELDGSMRKRKLLMYTTMEPCGKRLSGNTPCVQRIIQTRKSQAMGMVKGIDKVYFGVKEPGTFIAESQGCRLLSVAGIEWEHVPGLEEEILRVATAGHEARVEEALQPQLTEKSGTESTSRNRHVTNIDDITPEERRRQEQLPRNPKKRMMEMETSM